MRSSSARAPAVDRTDREYPIAIDRPHTQSPNNLRVLNSQTLILGSDLSALIDVHPSIVLADLSAVR